ncbi:MAG TPA: GTPase Era [Clostridiales bacterium]|nr:GTPase Era [Clostridiales bacterium]
MTRSAFVSIVGRPNVGKSTLLNALVGEHVAIVSPKPQTTRTRITGILTRGEDQFVFIDTPGMHVPRTKLGDYMVGQVNEGMADVDVALLVTEPTGEIHPIETTLLERLRQNKTPVILILNKVDALAKKELMMEKIAAFAAQHDFAQVIPLSAQEGDGIDILLQELSHFAKPSPHYFDEDSYTEQPERVIVAELIREKMLLNLRDEIPHGVAVVVEQMKDRPDGSIIDIAATIYCEKDTHKGIIIGAKGETLKKIGSQARVDIEQFLQAKVNLQCWVKVRKDWRNREDSLRQLGFR